MIVNTIFHKVFLTLKGYSAISVFLGQPSLYIFKSAQYIRQFTSLYFQIILGGFRCLPGEKFWKIDIFPGESSRPHRGTEIGYLYGWNQKVKKLPTQESIELFWDKTNGVISTILKNLEGVQNSY